MKFSKSVMDRLIFVDDVDYFEKGRPRASERKDPSRRQAEAAEDAIVLPHGGMGSFMGNPGSTEAEHYARTSEDAKRNLAKLAESKDPHDRKAAAAGMKRHD